MEKINYKEISNWTLATDFYYTWVGIFTLMKNNPESFYIWHPLYNMNLSLKCIEVGKYMTPSFEIDGIIANDFDEHIRNIKFKREKKNMNRNTHRNNPYFNITHNYEKNTRHIYTKPKITHTDTIRIPCYEYNSNVDSYVSIIETLFERINLKDKKKLYKGIKRWKDKEDIWSLISFWKCINEIFIINFELKCYLDTNLKNIKVPTYYNGRLYIDTKEHYNMRKKSEIWLMNKQTEEKMKNIVKETNI